MDISSLKNCDKFWKMEDDLKVFEGTTYSLLERPPSHTKLVLDEQANLLGQIDLHDDTCPRLRSCRHVHPHCEQWHHDRRTEIHEVANQSSGLALRCDQSLSHKLTITVAKCTQCGCTCRPDLKSWTCVVRSF